MQRLGARHPLMGRLKGVYRKAWYENQRLFFEMYPVIARLAARGIDILLLKGAPLVLTYYGNSALRPMADVDVAVRRGQLRETIAALRDDGWKSAVYAVENAFRFQHAVRFFGRNGVTLDLHANVISEAPFEPANESLWSWTESLLFGETRVRQLDSTAQLLHTVIHGVRRNVETPVRWIPDALVVLRARADAIDWDRIVTFAERWRITYRLSLGLGYLASRFDAPIPPGVLERLGRSRLSLLERIENTVALSPPSRFQGAVGNQWVILSDYCRTADAARARSFVPGLTHYVRYRWNLQSRRDIALVILRGVRRRLGALASPDAPHTAHGGRR
jgi:hypothetical protein